MSTKSFYSDPKYCEMKLTNGHGGSGWRDSHESAHREYHSTSFREVTTGKLVLPQIFGVRVKTNEERQPTFTDIHPKRR